MEHIFITGPSGAGKTTMAKTVAERSGKQLIHLDRHLPIWGPYLESKPRLDKNEDLSKWLIAQASPGTPENREYMDVMADVVRRTMMLVDRPSVIEGSQLLAVPEVAGKHLIALVLPPKDVVVARRLRRDTGKLMAKNLPMFTNEQVHVRQRVAELLYDMVMPLCYRMLANKDLFVLKLTS